MKKRLLLVPLTQAGKTRAQNAAVPLATGETILFSDANSLYETGAPS
jgi:hypothetical protein